MSYCEKAIDRTPFIPGAGITSSATLESADYSIRQDLYYQPSTKTPDNIKKYRDSLRQRIGVKQYHPGIYNDPKDYENFTHGMRTKSSEHVPDCINGDGTNGNKQFMNQLAELQYASSKREPLGKSIVRNYNFPEAVKQNGFRFGIPSSGFGNAKELLYSGKNLEEPDYVKKLYFKTHGITDPGQQSTRYYNWDIDPTNHRFGYSQGTEEDGVKKSLLSDSLNNPYPQTKLIGKRLEDFHEATAKLLGKGKFTGSMPPRFYDENHIFGKESKLGDEWNAGRCIHGDKSTVTPVSVSSDIDLGRDWHYRSRLKNLYPSQRDPYRIYGVPSIRRDLKIKHRKARSVCDINNYGDEPDAYDLLYPHPEAIRGVYDEDFEELLTKEEIYSNMRKYDFIIPEEEFDLIYDLGLKNYPNSEGKMSPKSFISTMRNLKREYQKYRIVLKSP